MSNGTDGKKLSPSLLVTLGLTGMVNTAVSCGPCLDYAYPDTATDTGDTGDTEDDQRASGGDRGDARQRVLQRGVLPDDVAKLLAKQRTE